MPVVEALPNSDSIFSEAQVAQLTAGLTTDTALHGLLVAVMSLIRDAMAMVDSAAAALPPAWWGRRGERPLLPPTLGGTPAPQARPHDDGATALSGYIQLFPQFGQMLRIRQRAEWPPSECSTPHCSRTPSASLLKYYARPVVTLWSTMLACRSSRTFPGVPLELVSLPVVAIGLVHTANELSCAVRPVHQL
jgi:hypothetical protein